MKLLVLNGSPKPNGNTGTALGALMEEVQKEGIETEMITLGGKTIHGCIGCGQCGEKKNGKCNAFEDEVNEILPKMFEADAIVLGSPVYFSGINGTLKSFLDRAFFVCWVNGGLLRLKPAAGLVALRRSGGTCAFDQLNKYFQISEMLTVGSCYWNIVHGFAPGEAEQDLEGMHIARTLGRNLAWTLKIKEHAEGKITPPAFVAGDMTNFVR